MNNCNLMQEKEPSLIERNAIKILKLQNEKRKAEIVKAKTIVAQRIEKLSKIRSSLVFKTQQSEVFQKEIEAAMQSLREVYSSSKPHHFSDVGRTKNPTNSMLSITHSFIECLTNQEMTWNQISIYLQNEYSKIKKGMSEFAPEAISETKMQKLLQVWRKSSGVFNRKQLIGLNLMEIWILKSVEYKFKKEMLKELQKQQADIIKEELKYQEEVREINQFIQKLSEEADQVNQELEKVEQMKKDGMTQEEIVKELNKKFKLEDRYGIVQEGDKQKVVKRWKIQKQMYGSLVIEEEKESIISPCNSDLIQTLSRFTCSLADFKDQDKENEGIEKIEVKRRPSSRFSRPSVASSMPEIANEAGETQMKPVKNEITHSSSGFKRNQQIIPKRALRSQSAYKVKRRIEPQYDSNSGSTHCCRSNSKFLCC